MNKTSLCISIIILLIMSLISISILLNPPKDEVINTEIQENCNHEYVTVSEYNWWFKNYRTFSRCIKCGKEIR